MLLTPLSNVGVVDLEVCCPILGTFHSAPRYFNFIDRSEVSVGRVPHSMMLEMLEIFWNGYQVLLPFHVGTNILCMDISSCNNCAWLKFTVDEHRLEAPATSSDYVHLLEMLLY